MAITQDRMIALIKAAKTYDEKQLQCRTTAHINLSVINAALGNDDLTSEDKLAVLLDCFIQLKTQLDNPIDPRAVETILYEEVHFRVRYKSNTASKNWHASRRAEQRGEAPQQTQATPQPTPEPWAAPALQPPDQSIDITSETEPAAEYPVPEFLRPKEPT